MAATPVHVHGRLVVGYPLAHNSPPPGLGGGPAPGYFDFAIAAQKFNHDMILISTMHHAIQAKLIDTFMIMLTNLNVIKIKCIIYCTKIIININFSKMKFEDSKKYSYVVTLLPRD